MTRPFLVLVGSSGVGSYINAMANAVSKYDVDSIALINVIESPSGQQVDFEDFANKVLWDTLCGLVDGIYKEKDRQSSAYREVAVPEAKNCEAYKKLKQVFGSSHYLHTVNYKFFRNDIGKLKDIYGDDAIVDISGAPKRVAIDALTACLGVGLSNVMLFELEKPARGIDTLYHNLKEADYEHVVLPNWEPLIGNIEFFSARQNRRKLWIAVSSILASIILTVFYQLVRTHLGEGNLISWFLVSAIAIIGLVGGVTPIVDAWGGIRLALSLDRRKKV